MSDMIPTFRNMAIALFVGYRAMINNETPVACILVSRSTNQILSIGYNDTNRSLNGTRHAEFIAIDKVMSQIPVQDRSDIAKIQAFFGDIILYVTVEPCIMCASALKQIGIGYVVYGCGNDRFGGNGTILSIHQDKINKAYQSYGGVLRTEAVQLLRNFYIQENDSAPNPKIKKNKELENKEYPPNLDFKEYLSPEEFAEFFGDERFAASYDNRERELTPVLNRGYTLREILRIEDLLAVTELEEMYQEKDFKDKLEKDLQNFYGLFYDIDEEGKVDFNKIITKIDQVAQINPADPADPVNQVVQVDGFTTDLDCKKRKLNT